MSISKIYCDYAASTPVAPRVLRAMAPYWERKFGNPGSLHFFGQQTMAAIDLSREKITRLIGAQFREFLFFGSATEANNFVMRGIYAKWHSLPNKKTGNRPRIIISSIEHESILETARDLERIGAEIIILPVDKNGVVSVSDLIGALNENSILVSIMFGNNEIGTVQPINKLVQAVAEFRKKRASPYPLFHTDAVQVFSYIPIDFKDLEVDIATFSGHKMYGPKGVAGLFIRVKALDGLISPLITGGGQEFGFRSGTENVPLIVGLSEAMVLSESIRKKEAVRIHQFKKYFLERLKEFDQDIEINGPSRENGLPHILNVSFSAERAADFLVYLDLRGVAVSAGSACQARSSRPSHVLEAIGVSKSRAERSIRFSFGRGTNKGQIDKIVSIIKNKY